MIFKTLTIQNFLSIKSIKLDLQDRGLVLLQGENRDNDALNNNGAGKSSIIEALVYALYGRTIRGLSGDDVVNNITNKNMKVWLDLEDDNGEQYRIARYRKHSTNKNKAFLFKGSTDITPKSVADFNGAVADLLQADYVTFTSSLLYTAESFKFTSSTDAEMKATFDTMLGLDVYQKCLEITKNRLRTIEGELALTETKINSKNERIEELEKQISDTTKDRESYINSLADKRQHLLEVKAKDEAEKQRLLEQEDQTNVELETAKAELEKAKVELEKAKAECEAIDQLRNALQSEKSDLADLQISLRKETVTANQYKSDIETFTAKIEKATAKISMYNSKKEELDGTIGKPCPTCGQPLTAESIEPAKKEYDEKINDCNKDIETFTAKIEKATQSQVDGEEIAKKLKAQIDAKNATINEYRALLEQSKAIEEDKQKATEKVNDATLDVKKVELNIKSLGTQLSMLTANLKSYDVQLQDLGKDDPYTDLIEKAKANQETCRTEVEQLKNSIKDKLEEKNCLNFWAQAYSNSGIKSYVLDDITPFLNKRANKYLSKLTSGRIEVNFSTSTTLKSGEKREKFSIEILNKDGGSAYLANSGGEKKRVDLAINLALQDLVASRSNKRMNIAIFDEAFDALDQNGIESVMELLLELQSEKSTIIVISHNEHLKSYVTNTITVVKENGFSTLKSVSEEPETDEEDLDQ